MKVLTIVSYYTKKYCYAVKAQARRVLPNILELDPKEWTVHYVACTDRSPEALEAFEYYRQLFMGRATCHQILNNYDSDAREPKDLPYKEAAQLLIAQMTEAVLDLAKLLNSDYCWMIEADVLPAANSLRCLLDVLSFDNGYYGVAFSTYPSNGGGSFLGGFGTPIYTIGKDFLPSERNLSKKQLAKLAKFNKEEEGFRKKNKHPSSRWIARRQAFDKELDKTPAGLIWDVIAKHGWRRRGWLNNAYPAIGKGMIVPIDWCGTGNTLLSKKALNVSTLDGYVGQGTQDLFLVWHRWYPIGIKIGLTTQCLSDHVIRVREPKEGRRLDKLVHLISYFETQGETIGHLRWRPAPWYSGELDEQFDPKNDGNLIAPPPEPKEGTLKVDKP